MDLIKTVFIFAIFTISLTSATRVTYKSCSEVLNQSGIYWISLNGAPFQVYCEQEKYAGHWLVFQSRNEASTSFNRSWNDYKYGFGSLGNNFWLGLDKLHQVLTVKMANYDLMVVMDDYLDFFAFQRYEHFVVNSEAEEYSLSLSQVNYGTAGESFLIYNNEKFSTFDRVNNKGTANCAAEMAGGYWHYDCRKILNTRSNLNGLYDLDHIMRNGSGMWWGQFGGTGRPLKKTRMMIKIRE